MNDERGSALIISIIVMVILTLLGISFLLMADTENQIAQNELRSAQALQAAESGVRMVKRWFDSPFSSLNVSNPTLGGEIDLTQRLIETDGDPATAAVAQDGSSTYPRYKQGVDLDGDGSDDLFQKPYRGSEFHALMGTEGGPDMRIRETDSTQAANFLAALSTDLFGAYPGDGVSARITQIDIYGPPYIDIAGVWTRYGMATVTVIARMYQTVGGAEQVLAERMVKAVINEMPYPGPYGPLHSCDNLSWNGDFTVKWGPSSATGEAALTNSHLGVPVSWPRVPPPGPRVDGLWTADWANYMAAVDGEEIEDPWFRFYSGGPLDPSAGGFLFSAPAAQQGDDQPFAFDWVFPNAVGDGHWPNHNHEPGDDGSHSNVFQNQPMVTCPDFNYEIWKAIVTSGGSDVHYYVWDNGTSFKENGIGAAQTFQALTDNHEGLFFFDTVDGVAPYDNDGNGTPDNLTPTISITAGTWGVRGFIYLNALTFQTRGASGRAVTFNAPGEPYDDTDVNGQWDAGEPYINLTYPTVMGNPFIIDTTDMYGGAVMRNDRGPDIASTASLWGIMYNSGHFEATGNAVYYGSIVAKSGVGSLSPSAGTPVLYWDESIVKNWPPPGWDLPRVVITKWETDL